ncbi:MAG: hypothetical protein J6Q22_04735 [Prevotella sp.]|nr:hypothetical protein [Prevotella sp.]
MMKRTKIQANSIHWNKTNTTDDKMAYLCCMRNLKEYAKRGFCDFYLAALKYSDYPSTLALRVLAPYKHIKPTYVDWNDYDSAHVFLRTFIFKLTEAYHTKFNQVAFNEAWNEFSQYLTAGRSP